MSADTLILGAFCVFILLVGVRLKQQYTGDMKQEKAMRLKSRSRFRFILTVVQLMVLGGLIVYMVPRLWEDFQAGGQVWGSDFFLRCLIFVFTIYIFVSGSWKLLRHRNKENVEK